MNVDRMKRHMIRSTPDAIVLPANDPDYHSRLDAWSQRMHAKHGDGEIHLELSDDRSTVRCQVRPRSVSA